MVNYKQISEISRDDQKIIGLLHNIKDAYNTRIGELVRNYEQTRNLRSDITNSPNFSVMPKRDASETKSAKKNSKINNKKTPNDDRGGHSSIAKPPVESADDGWGVEATNTQEPTQKVDDGWGVEASNTQEPTQQVDDGWGVEASNTQESTQKVDIGWGSTEPATTAEPVSDSWEEVAETKKDTLENKHSKKNNKANKKMPTPKTMEPPVKPADDGWGVEDTNTQEPTQKVDDGWGVEASNTQEPTQKVDDGWGVEASNTQESTQKVGKGWGSSEPIKTAEPTTTTEPTTTDEPTSDSWGEVAETRKNTPDSKPAKKNSKINNKKTPNDDKGRQSSNAKPPVKSADNGRGDEAINSLKPTEKVEMTVPKNLDDDSYREKYLTTKLDFRMLQKDNENLTKELEQARKKIEDLTTRIKDQRVEQETLKFKIRTLTTDLITTNDEISSLNKKLDLIEAEKSSREDELRNVQRRRMSQDQHNKTYEHRLAELSEKLHKTEEDKKNLMSQLSSSSEKIKRYENDLNHCKALIRTLKEGCQLVETQARDFETRHDTVRMSKAELERDLLAIKEEASMHITSISKLQKSNKQLSLAFQLSIDREEKLKKELDYTRSESAIRIENLKVENHRLNETNSQLRKLVDFLQSKD